MSARPKVVVFDVNETLSDMEPLRARFVDIGAPGHLFESWFAGTLRDGFALTAAGAYAEFSDVAAGVLRVTLTGVKGLDRDLDGAIEHVLKGFAELAVHPDVPDGMRKLHDAGIRMVTLTNGSSAMSEGMLARAGVLDLLEDRMSVSETRRWKPDPSPYHHAASKCGVSVEQAALIAVHPWDNDGAKRAGLIACWINRKSQPYPQHFLAPDHVGPDLATVANALIAGGD